MSVPRANFDGVEGTKIDEPSGMRCGYAVWKILQVPRTHASRLLLIALSDSNKTWTTLPRQVTHIYYCDCPIRYLAPHSAASSKAGRFVLAGAKPHGALLQQTPVAGNSGSITQIYSFHLSSSKQVMRVTSRHFMSSLLRSRHFRHS